MRVKGDINNNNDEDVPIPELDRASYSMLVPEYRTLQNNLELQLSLKDENVVLWAKELEKEIIVFQEKVGEEALTVL